MKFRYLLFLTVLLFITYAVQLSANSNINKEDLIKIDKLIEKNTIYEYSLFEPENLSKFIEGSIIKTKVINIKDSSFSEKAILKTKSGEFIILSEAEGLSKYIKESLKKSLNENTIELEKIQDKLFEFSSDVDIDVYKSPNKQINHVLYSFDECIYTNIKNNLISLEKDKLVVRNLKTGKIISSKKIQIEFGMLDNIIISKNGKYIYHVSFKVIDRKKRLAETIINKIDIKTGIVKNLIKTKDTIAIPRYLFLISNNLVIAKKNRSSTQIFNLKTLRFESEVTKNDMRMIFRFDKKGIALVKEINEKLLPLYYCDFTDNYKLTKIGKYQPDFVYSSENPKENKTPHMILNDDKFKNLSSPITKTKPMILLATKPNLKAKLEELDGHETIMDISVINDEFFLVKQFSKKGKLLVFNFKNPIYEKKQMVSLKDRNSIKKLLNKNITTNKSLLVSKELEIVFDAIFYNIAIITTEKDETGSMKSTENIKAVKNNKDEFLLFKEISDMTKIIKKDFILNPKTAKFFQDALDILFPLGHFDKKHKKYYQKGEKWFFIRGETFNKKTGVVVTIDNKGKIVKINKIRKDSLKIKISSKRELN